MCMCMCMCVCMLCRCTSLQLEKLLGGAKGGHCELERRVVVAREELGRCDPH